MWDLTEPEDHDSEDHGGLLKPDSGEIYIDDIKLFEDYNRLKELIGYMPDFFGVYDNLKVMEYLEFYASAYGMETKDAQKLGRELLKLVRLEGKRITMWMSFPGA